MIRSSITNIQSSNWILNRQSSDLTLVAISGFGK